MPRCLMAKKWKAYPWPDRVYEPTIDIDDEEEIDVVGDSPAALAASGKVTSPVSCWGPSSPTAGSTAPSPPPHSPEATCGSTMLYNGNNVVKTVIFCLFIMERMMYPNVVKSRGNKSNFFTFTILY